MNIFPSKINWFIAENQQKLKSESVNGIFSDVYDLILHWFIENHQRTIETLCDKSKKTKNNKQLHKAIVTMYAMTYLDVGFLFYAFEI